MNHLIDFGVCALNGLHKLNIFTLLLLKDILIAFWVFKCDAT